ncbi:MAG: murein biosynthesis integral membrane protein MurJ, partial [Candidatus Binataceae bacterium]
VEFTLLRRSLNRRLGWTGLERGYLVQLWAMALAAGAIAFAIKHQLHAGPRLTALAVIPVFAAVYLGLAYWTQVPELTRIIRASVARLRPR